MWNDIIVSGFMLLLVILMSIDVLLSLWLTYHFKIVYEPDLDRLMEQVLKAVENSTDEVVRNVIASEFRTFKAIEKQNNKSKKYGNK